MAEVQQAGRVAEVNYISAEKSHYLRRSIVVWFVIIFAESLHGILRVAWLQPLVGDFRARQIAFFSGLALILTITLLFIRWLRAETRRKLLAVGWLWLALTLTFEFVLGVFVLGYSWPRMLEDYNLMRGGLMGLGLLFLLCAPLLAARLRGVYAGR